MGSSGEMCIVLNYHSFIYIYTCFCRFSQLCASPMYTCTCIYTCIYTSNVTESGISAQTSFGEPEILVRSGCPYMYISDICI